MNMTSGWFIKMLIALVITTINFNMEGRGKPLVHHSKLQKQSNGRKRHYMVTTEEIEDTFFVPQPAAQTPAVVPNYPVSVLAQPALQIVPPVAHIHQPHHHHHKNEHNHEHGHRHEHKYGHEHGKEHVYLQEPKNNNLHENIHEQEKTSSTPNQMSKPSYRATGCYKDALPRAVPSLEGSDSTFREYYKTRINAIEKCAKVAQYRGYEIFTIQNGGLCSSGPNAHSTFQTYGPAENCKNGRGGEWASDVYIFNDYAYEITVYTGTEQKSSTDAKVSVTLHGSLGSSRDIILKSGASTNDPFQSGQADKFLVHSIPLGELTRIQICHDNTGPQAAWYLEKVVIKDAKNMIYIFPCNCWLKYEKDKSKIHRNLLPATILNPGSFKYLGCFKESENNRAIPGIVKDTMLDGHSSVSSTSINTQEYVIERCAYETRQRGFTVFGIHNGSECVASSNAQDTYDMYGTAVDCNKNGTGGVSSNAVYTFTDQEPSTTSPTGKL